jgi:hypothetical protein
MATSGSFDFNLTRDDAIEVAMRHCGRLADGQTPSANELTDVGKVLNAMLKSWPNEGTQLHLQQKIYLFPAVATNDFTLHQTAASSNECTTAFFADTLAAALAASATAVTLTDTDVNSLDGDRIGIMMDTGVMHWTTIASGGGTVNVVLTTGVTAACASGNQVYFYTSKTLRPERFLTVTHKTAPTVDGAHNVIDGTETPVELIGKQDWADLSQKTTDGTTNQAWWDPQHPAGTLRIWPQIDPGDSYIVAWVERQHDDMDAAANDFAVPQRWYGAVGWELASWICSMFGVSERTAHRIDRMASRTLSMAEAADTEESARLTPDDRYEGYF